MLEATTKYELYKKIKQLLLDHAFIVNPYREINYGLQFLVFYQDQSGLVRIYDGKKGLRIDFSQCKHEALAQKIGQLIEHSEEQKLGLEALTSQYSKTEPDVVKSTHDPDDLIGVDESGKGDFFGPLVVAAVHNHSLTQPILKKLGVQDSKTLTDTKIRKIAPLIKKACKHSLVILGNDSYNSTYETMKNLNHILAWGHSKVIESTLKQHPCPNALSDQFGHASLIKNWLRSKGVNITLYQRPKAEDNIAVAAASVLARDAFLSYLDQMESEFQMRFPKGCSDATISAGVQFCKENGIEKLSSVAKLHFKVTQKIEALL